MQQQEEKKNPTKTNEDKIQNLKQQIIANSKDAAWAKNMLLELMALQRQADVEAVELSVPVSEVKQSIDFGAYSLKKTIRGILFTAKGGMSTFVDMRMQSVYEMLDRVFEWQEQMGDDDDSREVYDAFVSAVAYVFQAPIFCSLGEGTLFDVATHILKCFNEYCEENYTNAKPHEETEEDIRDNIIEENMAAAMDIIANAPVPPEDN